MGEDITAKKRICTCSSCPHKITMSQGKYTRLWYTRAYTMKCEPVNKCTTAYLPLLSAPLHPTDCPRLNNPIDGMVTLSGLSVGSTASYTCDAGFFVNGAETRTCLGPGWSSSAPTCGEFGILILHLYWCHTFCT